MSRRHWKFRIDVNQDDRKPFKLEQSTLLGIMGFYQSDISSPKISCVTFNKPKYSRLIFFFSKIESVMQDLLLTPTFGGSGAGAGVGSSSSSSSSESYS